MTSQALIEVTRAITSEDMQRQFSTLLPPSIKPDRFTEATIAAISNFPEVLEADRDSLYRACVSSAKRGLIPDKEQGALVVYNTNVGTKEKPRWVKLVQFMPMVKGIIMEMAKAGIRAYAVTVYAKDKIALWNDDDGQHVHHEPVMFGDRGELVGVFAAGKDSTGRTYVEAMAKSDIEQVRVRSRQKAQDGSPTGTWKTDYDRMAQKSALHRLRKRLPITDEDAAQNLRDMDELPPDEEGTPREAGQQATQEAGAQPESPAAALPAPDSQQDEVLRAPPAKGNNKRKPRVLDQVMAAAKPAEARPQVAAAAAAPPAQAPSEEVEGDII